MVEVDEILAIVIGIIVAGLILVNYSKFKSYPGKNLLITAFLFALTSWIFSAVESVFLKEFFNLLQNICITITSILIAIWVFTLNKDEGD